MTKEEALYVYAAMLNTLDFDHLEPYLADDFKYASQWVLDEIDSKDDFRGYILDKLKVIQDSGTPVWAEIGYFQNEPVSMGVLVAQGNKDNLVGAVLAQVSGNHITRLDMCEVPLPENAQRSGIYPIEPKSP